MSGAGFWIALAMVAPVALALGNIYRAKFWPEGSTPVDLALVMSAAAALWLGAALVISGGYTEAQTAQSTACIGLAAASVLAAFGNVIYFKLQSLGGIVSFSQIGYAGATLGLLGGSLVLGESYPLSIWVAAIVIATGIWISERFKPQ